MGDVRDVPLNYQGVFSQSPETSLLTPDSIDPGDDLHIGHGHLVRHSACLAQHRGGKDIQRKG